MIGLPSLEGKLRPMRRTVPYAIPFFLGWATMAQGQFHGHRSYPQLRDLSGFAGGTFGVLPDGSVDPLGAMAISTPIGYALGGNQYVAGIGSLSDTAWPTGINFLRRSTQFKSDGSIQLIGGLDS